MNNNIKRLKYISNHRGCKEIDFILGKFANDGLEKLSNDEILLYNDFLSENDWDIYNWITKQDKSPEKYNILLEKILFINFS